MRLSAYFANEQYRLIVGTIKKAISDYTNCFDNFLSYVSHPQLLKCRKNKSGIVLVNDYMLDLELYGFKPLTCDCGYYSETMLCSNDIVVFFKNSKSRHYLNERVLKDNQNKVILVFYIDFDDCSIKVEEFSGNEHFHIDNDLEEKHEK